LQRKHTDPVKNRRVCHCSCHLPSVAIC